MKAIRFVIAFILGCSFSLSGQNSDTSLQVSTNLLLSQKKAILDSLILSNSEKRELTRTYHDIAWIYLNREGNAIEAENYVRHGDSIAYLLNDTSLQAESLTIRGRIYTRMGYFASALEALNRSLELKTALRDTGRMGYSINLIGRVFLSQNKYQEALSFYMRGMKLREALQQENDAFLLFRSISICYLKLNDFIKAREYALKALRLVEEGTRRSGKAYQSMAEVDFAEENYDLAHKNCLKAEEYLLKNGSNLELARVQILLSKVLFQLNRLTEAKTKAISAYQISTKEAHAIYLIEALEVLQSIAVKRNDFKESHRLNLLIKNASDDFYRQEDLIRSLDFETLYRVKERENLIAQLEVIKEENLKKIAIQEKQRVILIAILIAFSILLAIFIWFYFYKKKVDQEISSKDLTIKNQKINELKQEQKTIRLQAMIEGQEKERLRLSQDIHDSLGGLLSTAKIYLSEKKDTDLHLKNIIDRSCNEVREITNNLMPVSLKVVGLSDAIEDLAARVEILGINCNVEIYDLNITDEMTKLAVYRIVQELVNNVVKHADADQLLIQLIHSENWLHILIEDNGKGHNYEVKTNGMGINNVRSRLDLLGGNITYDSSNNKGTSVTIEVPIPANINTI